MEGRLALITGATSGIGKATCELFARKGIHLIISGRNSEVLQHLQENLSKQVRVKTILSDLLQRQERRHLIDILHAEKPDLILNNAGFGLYGEALTYATEKQLDILEVNGNAVLEITLEAARMLISANKKGTILNVSSAAAFQFLPNLSVYAASKAFVTNFSQAFDCEVKRYGVRVLTLCPGMVATDFQSRAGGQLEPEQAGVMTASFVAEQIWKQIEKMDPCLIIDWRYRLLNFLSFLLPKSWIAARVGHVIAKRIAPRTLIKIKQ